MPKRGKKYTAAAALINAEQQYAFAEAVKLAKQTSVTKFDATVEIHITTTADPRQADQIIRSTITLPAGSGKTRRIAVFAEGPDAADATKAGADLVGGNELIDKVAAGEIDFDIAVATPDMMKSLARVAKTLGPKGLMPSPKAGTVTKDVATAVSELKRGKIEFRTDKTGIIHSVIGKVSFTEADLLANLNAFVKAVLDNKPTGIKGNLIRTVVLATSMGPGIKVDPAEALK